MIKVNGQDANIIESKFSFDNYKHNGVDSGYCGLVKVKFSLSNKVGYFTFYVDNIINKDYSYYENKKYHNIPDDDNKSINFLELYDTNEFYSYFNNEMTLEFGRIENNKIKAKICIEEKTMSILFEDYIFLTL